MPMPGFPTPDEACHAGRSRGLFSPAPQGDSNPEVSFRHNVAPIPAPPRSARYRLLTSGKHDARMNQTVAGTAKPIEHTPLMRHYLSKFMKP